MWNSYYIYCVYLIYPVRDHYILTEWITLLLVFYNNISQVLSVTITTENNSVFGDKSVVIFPISELTLLIKSLSLQLLRTTVSLQHSREVVTELSLINPFFVNSIDFPLALWQSADTNKTSHADLRRRGKYKNPFHRLLNKVRGLSIWKLWV